MSGEMPPYYFRLRENGAFVFRITEDERNRRTEMDQIAAVNIRNGEIKAHGDRELSKADMAAIREWMEERRTVMAAREMDDIFRTVDQMNLTAQWAQTKADADQLEAVTDRLLMAMHDLRTVLVRKRADRIMRERGE